MSTNAPAPDQMVVPDGVAPPATVLVIGGSGFVGSAIVRAASAQPGLRAVSGGRRDNHASGEHGTTWRQCDAGNVEQLVRAFSDATYVVNCVRGDARTMINATRNICAAAQKTGVRRVVHISSMAVYGDAEGNVDETSALVPTGSYGKAKVHCESIVGAFIAGGGDAVVLRPGCVYGPGGQQWLGRVIRWLRAGRLGDLGALGEGYCNLTFNDDLAYASVAAMTADTAFERTFNVVDADPWTWNMYFSKVSEEIGIPLRHCPPARIYLEAGVLAYPLQAMKLTGQYLGVRPGRLPDPIPPSLLRLWRQRMRLDVGRARTILGFRGTPTERGVRLSVQSFQDARITQSR